MAMSNLIAPNKSHKPKNSSRFTIAKKGYNSYEDFLKERLNTWKREKESRMEQEKRESLERYLHREV
jgi:hypothetical protein